MTTTSASRHIKAPVAEVFDVVAHIERFSEAVPHITEVEFLTDQKAGVGTKFRETRRMRRGTATTDLEVTEYEKDDRIRLVSDAGGTIWDTVFTVTPEAGGTKLDMVGEARPYKFMAKLVVPLISPMLTKAIAADMDAIKEYCESNPP